GNFGRRVDEDKVPIRSDEEPAGTASGFGRSDDAINDGDSAECSVVDGMEDNLISDYLAFAFLQVSEDAGVLTDIRVNGCSLPDLAGVSHEHCFGVCDDVKAVDVEVCEGDGAGDITLDDGNGFDALRKDVGGREGEQKKQQGPANHSNNLDEP